MKTLLYPVLIGGALLLGFLMGYNYRGSKIQIAEAPAVRGTAAPALVIPAGQAVAGFLDKVDGQAVISAADGSEVKVSGWAGCADPASPLSKVEVLVDDQVKATATLSLPRPDVAAAYGRPDFDHSGWQASFLAKGFKPGTHAITARGVCSHGETGKLPAFQLAIQ